MAAGEFDARPVTAAGAGPAIPARTTKRRGRLGPGGRRILTDVAPHWSLGEGTDRSSPEGLAAVFGRSTDRLLDIGCGAGGATRAWASTHPDGDVIAVELHRPSIARLVRDLEASGPANVRVVEADAVAIIHRAAEIGSVTDVRILFPDPWPKRRHHDRRLVDARFIAGVADLLDTGGTLHVATDWVDYAAQIVTALTDEPRFGPVGTSFTVVRPERPVTHYEARALAAGRDVVDLMARRIEP